MLLLSWYLAALIVIFCYSFKVALARRKVTSGLRFVIVSSLFEIFAVYLAVGAFFVAMAFWVATMDAPDSVLQKLWECESKLALWKGTVEKIRAPVGVAFTVLVACALLAHWFNGWGSSFYKWFSWYQKHTKRITLAAAALASFSIFSGSVTSSHARIQARIKNTEEGYAGYKRDVATTATMATVKQLAVRVCQELPPSWNAVREKEHTIAEDSSRIQTSLTLLQVLYNSSRANPITPPRSPVDQATSLPNAEVSDTFSRAEAAPFSKNTLDALRSKLRDYREKLISKTSDLLSTSLGDKIPASAVEWFLSLEKWEVFRAASDDYPLFSALLRLLDKAIGEAIADHIKRLVAGHAAMTGKDPELELDTAATEFAKAVTLDWKLMEPFVSKAARTKAIELREVKRALRACETAEQREIKRFRDEETNSSEWLTRRPGNDQSRNSSRSDMIRSKKPIGLMPDNSFSSFFENTLKREANTRRTQEDKDIEERRIRLKMAEFREELNKAFAERYGLEYVAGEIPRVRGIRIGRFELPWFPIRVLKAIEGARIP